MLTIVDLGTVDAAGRERLATLTFAAARAPFPEWLPTIDAAREEVADADHPDVVGRVLLDDSDPVGWVAARHAWGRVWELHPLIVAVDRQRQGFGRRLAREVEHHAAQAGGLTMLVGTSDSTAVTSVGGIDLFADPLRALAAISTRAPHAYQFWQRIGHRIVGVVPDAEGPGLPSITLARRLTVAQRADDDAR